MNFNRLIDVHHVSLTPFLFLSLFLSLILFLIFSLVLSHIVSLSPLFSLLSTLSLTQTLSLCSFTDSLLKMTGFASINTYLLGGLESRCTSADGVHLPPYGPTLSDVHMADLDRHRSGLYCLASDHLRLLTAPDVDLPPLQHRQARADHLTDSESDEEDKYTTPVPSMKRVRALLRGKSLKVVSVVAAIENPISTKKGKAGSKGAKEAKLVIAASAPTAANINDIDDEDSEGDVNEKKSEQVELMRDRKTLELEGSLSRQRQGEASAYIDRLKVLSQASRCLMQASPTQTPFHTYQSYVLSSPENRSSVPHDCFVETNNSYK